MDNILDTKLALNALREVINNQQWDQLADATAALHVQDVAKAIDDLPADSLTEAFTALPEALQHEVFSYLDLLSQMELLDALDAPQGRALFASLTPDDRTSLLSSAPATQVEQLLRLLSADDMKLALTLLGYPEHSAGRLMTPRFVRLRPDWTLSQALAHVRRCGEPEEHINTLYVLDNERHLLSTVSLKRLVMLEGDQPVASLLADTRPVAIEASEDREVAVRLIQHYDITALPVVDKQGAMLGVVTVDDVMDVAQEETTEDFHKIGGMGAVGLSLRDARPSLLYRKRVGWLVLLVFMNIFGGAGIAYFEETIEAVIALVFFLPLIVDSGGNAGSQSATLMVRALATGDVQARDWLRLWGKELGVATALGLTMGAAVWGLGLWRGGSEVAMVVSLAMVAVVVIGSMVGMLLPFLLTRLKFDPATASAPLITSIADISGILIYFSIATAILTIPAAG
ncbi:MAG: magnesium transporter [Alcanivoracaceae bacterium]